MKILPLICILVLSQATQLQKINVPCIEEIGYLTKDLFVFGLDVARHKFCKQVKDVVVIIMEIIKLKKACSSSGVTDILEEHNKTLDCLQNTLDIAESAHYAYQIYNDNGLSEEFIDQATNIESLLFQTMSRCSNKMTLLNDIFPEQCLYTINSMVKQAIELKQGGRKMSNVVNSLISLHENYWGAREYCPFMNKL